MRAVVAVDAVVVGWGREAAAAAATAYNNRQWLAVALRLRSCASVAAAETAAAGP